jgi:diguanylate cyclase (GGDEF)-like protein/PAS domain S-box-containing protein
MPNVAARHLFTVGLRNWFAVKTKIIKEQQTRVLEVQVMLPLVVLFFLGAIWMLASYFIDLELTTTSLEAQQSSIEQIDTYEAQMVLSLASIDQTLKVLKYTVELKGAGAALPALEEQGLLPSSMVFATSVIDRSGVIIASNPSSGAISVAQQGFFQAHQNSESSRAYVSEVQRDSAEGEWQLHFTRRYNDVQGDFAGVVRIAVDPAYFTSGYEPSRLGKQGVLGLFSANGVFLAVRAGETVSWGQSALVRASHADGGLLNNHWDGVRRYTSVRGLNGWPLSVMVGISENERMFSFKQKRSRYLWQAYIATALLGLSAILIWVWYQQHGKSRRILRHLQQTYTTASEASLDAVFVLHSVTNKDGALIDFVIVAANGRAEKISGLSKSALEGRLLCSLLPNFRKSDIFNSLVKVAMIGGVHEQEWKSRLPSLRGKWLYLQVVGVGLDLDGDLVAIVRDISERKQSEERILHMARHDELTGLPNRSLIDESLDLAINDANNQKTGVGIAFIDLDNFKLINDGLGHSAGDDLLKVIARRILGCVRRIDTVGRFGSDEFIIIMADQQHDTNSISLLLERVREAVTQPVMLGSHQVKVSCSIGVARYPQDGLERSSLIVNADAAMYRAKEAGRNNYQFYAPEMNASVEQKLVLLEAMRSALAENQFHLLYQPKVDLKSGLIFGVEALIRWEHPQHGLVSPVRFIPLAEESGLIVDIGEWVLHTACLQNRAWQDAGLTPISVAVNVSPRQFEDKHLIEHVAYALENSGLDAGYLELEVTESSIMRDLARSVATMRQFDTMGIAMSIDDFGTGYSSLSALKSFPISRLKIDQSFVRELANNPDDQAIAMAVISLGHKLNMKVIAEGVETEQQRDFLHANECDEMQGYLFSRPVKPEHIESLLREQMSRMIAVAQEY